MKIGFLLANLDEDLPKFLKNIDYEFVIIEKSNFEEQKHLDNNVKLVRTLNFEKVIKDEDIRILFIDKSIDYKNNNCINVKIVDNELEIYAFDYDFYAVRSKKVENQIYFPYFIDFNFFSNYSNKLKKYEKVRRITILTNSFDASLISLIEKLSELKKEIKDLIFTIYKATTNQNYKSIVFISRELNKEERAKLYFFSDLIISIEDRKKEVLEAMSMKKIVITNDGFLNTPNLSFGNIVNKVKRLLEFKEYEANKVIASEFDIENSSKIFEKELKKFIEINAKNI